MLQRAGWAVLFLEIGGGLFSAVGAFSRAYPPRVEDWELLQQVEIARTEPERIRALVIGNSHAREALNSDELGRETLVLGLPLNDAAEIEHQVRTLVPGLPKLEVAYFGISYFTFHWSNTAADDEGLLYARRTFHSLFPVWRPVEADVASMVRGKAHWIARPDHWRLAVHGLRHGTSEFVAETEARRRYLLELRADTALVRHSDERLAEKLGKEESMMRRNPNLPAENYARLSTAIAALHRRGVRVVLFTPPYFASYRDGYLERPRTVEQRELMQRLTREHGVEYLDFSEHEMGLEARWFRDSDHLNPAGRTVFTRMLVEATEQGPHVTRPLAAP
jgi:hypothetical protein